MLLRRSLQHSSLPCQAHRALLLSIYVVHGHNPKLLPVLYLQAQLHPPQHTYMHVQVVEAAARRALAAERAQQQALQTSCQTTPKPAHDEAAPSTSGMVIPSVGAACAAN